jgi:coproporphyrinogen III oxidase
MSEAEQKKKATAWFGELQGKICKALEALEDEAPDTLFPGKAARCEK